MADADNKSDKDEIDSQDLDLVDDSLEDEGKDESEIWAEIESEESGDATHDTDDDPADDEPGDEDQGDATPAAAQSAQDDDEPAGTSGNADRSPDPWATATPEQKTAFEAIQEKLKKAEQSDRSQRGRVSALQTQIDQLRKDIATAPAADKKSAAKDDDGKPNVLKGSEDWESFEQEYPEVAKPVKDVIGKMQSLIDRQEKELAAIGSDRRAQALSKQADLLNDEYPTWQEDLSVPDFVPWLREQPRHIQEAASRNANEIVDAAEAADVVSRFKAFRSVASGEAPGADKGPNKGNNGTTRLPGKRQRQLESAAGTRSRGSQAPSSGIPEDGDPETIWKQFDKKEAREARG